MPPVPSSSLQDTTDNQAFAVAGGDLALRRIDKPHVLLTDSANLLDPNAAITSIDALQQLTDSLQTAAEPCVDSVLNQGENHPDNDSSDFDPERIRASHEDDLIGFLQRWSEELDRRAAKMHADMATHERRERAFRMWMQNRRLELETQIQEYREAKTKAEAAARRIAFTDS